MRYKYIYLEDLAANAFIEIMDKSDKREEFFVTYKKLEEYGAEVQNILAEKGEKAVLVLSGYDTRKFYESFPDYFEEKVKEEGAGVFLKKGVSADSLAHLFRGYLSLDILLAFMNKKAIVKLGV